MSVCDIGVIFTSILTLKQLYEDVEGNKKDCRNLIARCSALEKPLQAMQADKERLSSCQEALNSLQSVLEDCITFCRKYTGKRWLVKAYRNINCGDKDKFAELNARISASIADLQLSVNYDSMSGVSQGIFSLRHHLGDDMSDIKARVSELTSMVHNLLQSRSVDLSEPLATDMVIQTIRNSEELVCVCEKDENVETGVSPSDISTSSETTTNSTLTTSPSLSGTAHMQSGLLPIDHSQLVWNKEPASLLGAGAFGAVYKCDYLRTPCALKHFACLTLQLPTARELQKIRREARILQLASFHPNIIGYRGVDLTAGILLMELATCSLYDILYRKDRLSSLPIQSDNLLTLHTFTWKMHVMLDIISALSFLHFHSVLHRDIKSANILFVLDSSRLLTTGLPLVAKLSDFGLASAVGLSSSGQSVNDSTNKAVGTAVYMAPELLDFEDCPLYTPASDVYAMGMLANELLTEEVPWSGLRDIHVLNMVVNKRQRPTGYMTTDPLEQRVILQVIGNDTSGALHQNPEERPTASTLSKYVQQYFDILAENVNAITSITEKVVPLDRPTLMRQVVSVLFPSISDDELMEMICIDSQNDEQVVEKKDEESYQEVIQKTVIIPSVSEACSEEALSERLVDEFEFPAAVDVKGLTTCLEDILSVPTTPFASSYPDTPEILHTINKESKIDESMNSSVNEPLSVSSSTKSVKPVKPVKPTSLKTTTINPTAFLESGNDSVMVIESSTRNRIVALLNALVVSASTDLSGGRSNRLAVMCELIKIIQEDPSQQEVIALLDGIVTIVNLLKQCHYAVLTHSIDFSTQECVQVVQLVAYLAKNHPSHQSELVKQGVLSMLVHLLVHPTEEVLKESVISALIYLINNHATNQAALIELKALSELIHFVLQTQCHMLMGGIEALHLLTDIAISHRDFSSIVTVLQHGPEPMQVKMAQLITILAENNVDNQNALSQTNAMQVLITLLHDGSEELVEQSVLAMKSLATKHTVNREAIVSAGGIEPLSMLVINGLSTARVTAMDLLRVLCSHIPTLRTTIATTQLLTALKSIQDSKVTAKFVKHSADLLLKELTAGHNTFALPNFLTTFTQGLGK